MQKNCSAQSPSAPLSMRGPPAQRNRDSNIEMYMYIRFVDGLRVLTTTMILIGHSDVWPSVTVRMYMGTNFYIFLSGFITSRTCGGMESAAERVAFYRKRFVRCATQYYIALLLGVLAHALLSPPHYMDSNLPASVAAAALLVQAWWIPLEGLPWRDWYPDHYGANPALWTMSSLAFCWLAHPWIERLARRVHPRTLVCCTAAAAASIPSALYALAAALGADNQRGFFQFGNQHPLPCLVTYGAGVLANEWVRSYPMARWGGVVFYGTALVFALSLAAAPPQGRRGVEFLYVPWSNLCMFVMFVTAVVHSPLPTALLSHAAFRHLGKYTYEVYLLTFPVLWTTKRLKERLPAWLWGALNVPVAWLSAALLRCARDHLHSIVERRRELF